LKLIRDQAIALGITLLDFVSSFHLPKKSHRFVHASIVATIALVSSAPGCRRSPSELAGETGPVHREIPALKLLPPDARIILSLDLDHLRAEAAWKTILSALVKDTSPWLGVVLSGSGLNLTERLHNVLIALPGERQADDRFAVIADGDGLDDARVIAWLRRQTGQATVAMTRDHRQLVVGNGAWSQAMAGLATATGLSQSAADNPEMRRLCERTADGHGLWFAAVVPARVRRDLVQQDRFPDAASVMRMSGFADADAGLHAEVMAELSNTQDAVHLAHRLTVFLNQAKRHPQMLVLGLAPYLEAVHLEARDASVKASVELPATQFGEVIERIEALAHGAWTK
jgi:hypothetical protein